MIALVWAWIRAHPVWAALVAVTTAAAIAIGVQTHRLHSEQAAHARAALATQNAIATADTTREVYRDSMRTIVQRLALQQPQRPDSIDRILRAQRIALDEVRATIQALAARARSTDTVTVDAGGARHGTFDVREAPYTAHAEVSLPARGLGDIDLHVALDTLSLTLRLSCGAPNADGIRAASASVTAPPWATVHLARVEQDAGLCRSPALERAVDRSDSRVRLAIVAGYGLTASVVSVAQARSSLESRAFLGVAITKPVHVPRWIPWLPK